MFIPQLEEFPSFDLIKLLSTCFGKPTGDTSVCILIDLPELSEMVNHKFLETNDFSVQSHAVDKFYNPLCGKIGDEFNVSKCDLFAFKTTFGSNLDPEDDAMDVNGNLFSLEKDIYPHYDIILAITDYNYVNFI